MEGWQRGEVDPDQLLGDQAVAAGPRDRGTPLTVNFRTDAAAGPYRMAMEKPTGRPRLMFNHSE